MRVTNATWVWSDTHFGHKKIVQYGQRPESHEVIMLSNWIERVGEDDVILHLGDVFMGKQGNPKRWAKVLARMPGHKYVILGNHDKDPKLLVSAGFEVINPFVWTSQWGAVAFTHRPISSMYYGCPEDKLPLQWDVDYLPGWSINVHGHTHLNTVHPMDGDPLAGKTYVNVCVEHTEMAPVQIGSVLSSTAKVWTATR